MRRLILPLILILSGCELPDAGEEVGSSNTPAESQETVSTDTDGQAEWDKIIWNGASCRGATKVMTIRSASISGDTVSFDFDRWPWGSSMGLGHFFVWDGSTWKGGKFDWIRSGGQRVKTLENIRGGYNGLRAPAKGTRVAFAWTSADGDERSNLAETVWP